MIATALLISLTLAQSTPPPRRFALVLGVNQGDRGEVPLRYAEEDARRMLSVLREIGGVRAEDGFALLDVDAGQLSGQLSALEQRLRSARPVDQLVVYASGHADAEALHLKGTHFPLRELVEFIRRVPVGLAVLVLDSCQSGAATTRLKGLRPTADPMVGIAPELNGRVIISASSPYESAQESDFIQGSFFTHHLLAALRGAGDTSQDGRVSLDEAYRYAYGRTMESTIASRGGIQHPNFLVDLRGQGELILTEPARASAKLAIEVEAPGDWLVSSADTGAVLGQFSKGQGPLVLAVPPGGYRLRVRRDNGLVEAYATVADGETRNITEASLSRQNLWATRAKGPGGQEPPSLWVSLGPSASTGVLLQSGLQAGAALRLRGESLQLAPLDVCVVSLDHRDKPGAQRTGAPAESDWSMRLGLGRSFGWGRFGGDVVLEGGAHLVRQYNLPDGVPRSGLVPYLGLGAGAGFRLASWAELHLQAAGGVTLSQTLEGSRAGGYGELTLELAFRLPLLPDEM